MNFNKTLKKKKAGASSENESTASIDPSVSKCQIQRQYGILKKKKTCQWLWGKKNIEKSSPQVAKYTKV